MINNERALISFHNVHINVRQVSLDSHPRLGGRSENKELDTDLVQLRIKWPKFQH